MSLTAKDYLRAIKAYCRGCSGGSLSQAKGCVIRECPLWPMTDWHHTRIPKAERRREGVQMSITITIRETEGRA